MDQSPHFTSHFEQAPFSIQLLSPEGKTLAVNLAWKKLWQIPEEIIQNYILKDYLVAEDPQLELKGIASFIRRGLSGEIVEIPAIYYDPKETGLEGTPKWVTGHMYPVRDTSGEICEIVLTHQDVTQRKKAEEELQHSKDELAIIFEGVLDGILVQDKNLRLVMANSEGAKICGFSSASELCKASLDELISSFAIYDEDGNLLPVENLPGQKALKGEGPQKERILRIKNLKNGDESWARVSSQAIHNSQGEAYLAVSIFRDVTEEIRRHRAENFLNEVTSVLSTSLEYQETLQKIAKLAVTKLADWCSIDVIGESGPETVAVEHADPKKVEFAQSYSQKFPKDWNSATGSPKVLRTGEAEFYPHISEDLLQRSTSSSEQLSMIKQLGLRSAMIVPIKVKEKVLGSISFVRAESGPLFTEADLSTAIELSQRAGLALENARLYLELKKAVEARDQLISVCSHELNTPVTSIKLQFELIKRTLQVGGQDKRVSIINRQLNRMARLIDEMLDVTRINAGKLKLETRPIHLREVLQESIDRFADEYQQKGISLKLDLGQDGKVLGDEFRLDQVFSNILSNSLKYGEGLPVEVKMEVGEKNIRVSFQDQGKGVASEDLERIFERFERVAERSGIGGLGLGLFISREIIEGHGGRIWAEKASPKGMIFIVELPLLDESTQTPLA